MEEVKILNIGIHNIGKKDLLEKLTEGIVYTPNVDHIIKLQKDKAFFELYKEADYRLCDGKILQLASRLLGTPLKEKISGSDLFPSFYTHHKANQDIRIFLLGSSEGVAKKAMENINNKSGREIITGCLSPSFGFEKKQDECDNILKVINNSGATVLAIGVGAPKQEKWIHQYKSQLPGIKIFLALGATIDFEAGEKSRSPEWMSEWGLEWLFRLSSEPGRLWKRYLMEDPLFFWLLLKQKLGIYRDPFG